MGTRSRSLLRLACVLVLSGCAGSYFRAYQKSHPDWVFAFPDPDANLEQTVASLYAPTPTGAQLVIRRLEIQRIDVSPWQPVAFDALRSGAYQSSEAADYAVIADYACSGQVDLRRYAGEKVGWYLLRGNRLRAFDHYEFIEACTVHNDFQPLPPDGAALERSLVDYVAAHYPPSMIHVTELFQKGIVYARADRIDDAKRLLNEGRRAFDASADAKPIEFETPGVHISVAEARDAHRLHDQLVREIAAAEARLAAR